MPYRDAVAKLTEVTGFADSTFFPLLYLGNRDIETNPYPGSQQY
jgi:hypothetical protein